MEDRFMSTNDAWLTIDGDLPQSLRQAQEHLDSAGEELVLNFTAVRRLEPGAIEALEVLAARARDKGIRIVLNGVSVEVYKVLKLTRLSERFSFGI
jgi:anti-anti-sigma regulatory factor